MNVADPLHIHVARGNENQGDQTHNSDQVYVIDLMDQDMQESLSGLVESTARDCRYPMSTASISDPYIDGLHA